MKIALYKRKYLSTKFVLNKGSERYHEKGTYTEHVKGISKPWYSCDFVCCKFGTERHRCCGEGPGTKGCKIYRACCQVV